MYKRIIIIIVTLLVLFLLILSFSNKKKIERMNNIVPKEQKADQIEKATFYQTANKKYKTTGNPRFNFWFDIPISWDAEDRSSNGDGYFIIPENDKIDIRIYAGYKDSYDKEYYNRLCESNGKINDFQFRDGSFGKYIENKNNRYYIKEEQDVMINLFVNCENKWFSQNKDDIEYIARSIRRGIQRIENK